MGETNYFRLNKYIFIVKLVFSEIKIQLGSNGTIIKRGGANNFSAISPHQLSELKYWSWGEGENPFRGFKKCPRHMLRAIESPFGSWARKLPSRVTSWQAS